MKDNNKYRVSQKKIFSLFVTIILLVTIVSSQTIAFSVKKTKENDFQNNRYIIEFVEEPISVFKYNLKNTLKDYFNSFKTTGLIDFLEDELIQQRDKISTLHQKAKQDILNLLGLDSDNVFLNEYRMILNGICVQNIPTNILEKIKKLPYVKNIIPDKIFEACLDDSVPLIDADDVWDLTDDFGQNVTGKGINIAVLDTGVDYNHPDLMDRYVDGYDFVTFDTIYDNGTASDPRPEDDDPLDDNGHGTHCIGIIMGNGSMSSGLYTGVAPEANLYAYKVLNRQGRGFTSWFLSGMERAIDPNNDGDDSDHVDIISISSGVSDGHPDDLFSQKADWAVRSGVVVVAAAGNDGGYGTINSPGCARKVICVGASTKYDTMFIGSSRGPTQIGTIKPDVVAPGVDIVSTLASGTSFGYSQVDDYYVHAKGTSMACPHVAGVAALIKQKHPDWTPDEIKMAIRNTADDIGKEIEVQGYGRVNAFDAVNLSNAPPVAFLNTSGEVIRGLVKINGTASGEDFFHYVIAYNNTYRDELFSTMKLKTVIDDVLDTIDTSKCIGGRYKVTLSVLSEHGFSQDIVYMDVELSGEINDTIFVNETETFIVKTSEGGNPLLALGLFIVPYHIPKIKIKYTDHFEFKAPTIRVGVDILKGLNGKIYILSFKYGLVAHNVTIFNLDN